MCVHLSFVDVRRRKYIPLPYTINYGLAEVGYVYVPPSCENAAKECKLHVALHGCNMTAANVGMDFIQKAGYNSWADANDFVLLLCVLLL